MLEIKKKRKNKIEYPTEMEIKLSSGDTLHFEFTNQRLYKNRVFRVTLKISQDFVERRSLLNTADINLKVGKRTK